LKRSYGPVKSVVVNRPLAQNPVNKVTALPPVQIEIGPRHKSRAIKSLGRRDGKSGRNRAIIKKADNAEEEMSNEADRLIHELDRLPSFRGQPSSLLFGRAPPLTVRSMTTTSDVVCVSIDTIPTPTFVPRG
jgi:hypothetical protein